MKVAKRKLRNEKIKEFNKQEIIDAAESLFYEHGYDNVTMAGIAEYAAFSRQTLYSYFKCKEELILEVIMRGTKKRMKMFEEEMIQHSDAFNQIKALGTSYYKFYSETPEYLRLQVHLDNNGIDFSHISESLLNDFYATNRNASDLILSAYRKGLEEGSISDQLPDNFVTFYLPMTLRAILLKTLIGNFNVYYKNDVSKEKATKHYFEFLDLIMSSAKPKESEQETKQNKNKDEDPSDLV